MRSFWYLLGAYSLGLVVGNVLDEVTSFGAEIAVSGGAGLILILVSERMDG